MSCCCEPGCLPVPVANSCVIPGATYDNAALDALCAATPANPSITMTEVGTATAGPGVFCHGTVTPATWPEQSLTVPATGLTEGCVVFFIVTWADDFHFGCDADLGETVTVAGTSGVLGPATQVDNQFLGFQYGGINSYGFAVYWAPVLADGDGDLTFFWPNAVNPVGGEYSMQQVAQAFQVCGDINADDPVSAFITQGGTMPSAGTLGDESPTTIVLPADDCPAIYFGAARHVGNENDPANFPNGGFTVDTGTEVAEYVPREGVNYCQMGTVGGTIDDDSATLAAVFNNVNNWWGDIGNHSLFTAVRINCSVPAVVELGQCCVDITNGECNGDQPVDISVDGTIDLTADAGSNLVLDLLVDGAVVDTIANDNSGGGAATTVSGSLSYVDTGGPVGDNALFGPVCAELRLTCLSFTGTGNSLTNGDITNQLEITP